MLKYYLLISLFFSATIYSNENATSEPENEISQKIADLDWKGPGIYTLENSHSLIEIPEGFYGLLDEHAREYDLLTRGYAHPDLEATMFPDQREGGFLFYYCDEGYVSIKDWDTIDADELLTDIAEATERANIERNKLGLASVHVVGWISKPRLSKETNTVTWSTEGRMDGEERTSVNVVVLKLGRQGHERMVWVISKDEYSATSPDLDILLYGHQFAEGYRYGDFTTGDKIATYGIASLVAATAGAKMIKAGGILFALKKFWGFGIAGLAALFYKVRSYFKS